MGFMKLHANNWILKQQAVVLLFLLCYVLPAYGQQLDFDFFTVNEGLSDRQITELYIDKQGFVWAGTRDGLNRFDGYNFEPFGQGPYSAAGLSSGEVRHIGHDIEDKLVLLYEDYNSYFDRFDPQDFTVEQTALVPGTGIFGFPQTLTIDDLGRVFAVTITRDGPTLLYEYTLDGFKEISRFEDDWDKISASISLLPLRNGQFLLFDVDHGLRHLSATGELIGKVSLDGLNAQAIYGGGRLERLNFLAEGPAGQIYFSFFNHPGIYQWSLEQDVSPFPVLDLSQEAYYYQLFKDHHGQLLISSRETPGSAEQPDHFYLVDENGDVQVFDDLLKAGSRVYAATALDFREKIYLGLYNGLGVVERRSKRLDTYLAVDQEEEFMQTLVRGICEDRDGLIYVLEESGILHRLDPVTDVMDTLDLYLDDTLNSRLSIVNAMQLIYDATTHSLWGCGRTPGGQRTGLLFNYDIVACTITVYTYPGMGFTSMTYGPDDRLYLGGKPAGRIGEILVFDRLNGAFHTVRDEQNRNFLQQSYPNYLTASRTGKILIGTEDKGFMAYDPKTQFVKTYSPESGRKEATIIMNDYTVYVIHEDDNGQWWVGTKGGLHRVDPETEEVVYYGREDGLSSQIVSGILPDSAGGFWLSTYYGLTHLLPGGPTGFRRYYRADGLSNDEFNRLSFFRGQDGRYYFGGVNGLTAFYPEELSQQASQDAQVVITEVSLYGRDQQRTIKSGLSTLAEVVMRPSEKGIAISFALPATNRAGRNRFRVKLSGLNEDWVELNNEHTARYNNLPGGKYILHIQGADANGNYAAEIVTLPIRVRQYIYERTGFLILMGFILTGLLIGFLQGRSRERLRNEQLRTQLSSDIHDEVSGLLAGITMQTELLQSYTEDKHLQRRLQGVGEAGRKAMSKMSDVIWSIDSRRDTVGDLFQRMQEHADDVLLPLDIRYQFKAEGMDDHTRKVTGSKRQDLYFIYKEAINNIARHSNATKVSIYLGQRGQEFEMIIRDNGHPTNGFDARRSVKTGQGLANLQMRAQRLEASLRVDPESGYAIRLRMKKFA